MYVVYIITRSDTLGGAQIHVRDMAKSLLKEGHNTTVVVGRQGVFTELVSREGIPVVSVEHLVPSIRPYGDARALIELLRVVRRLNPDLVAVHSAKAGLLGRIAARVLGKPVTYTAHGWPFAEGIPGKRRAAGIFVERLAASLADKIITVSEHDRRLALRYGIAPAGKLVTVHNGIPDVPGKRAAVQTEGNVRLIMVARLDTQKNHALLLDALSRLRHLDWCLTLVGDGPLEESIRRHAARLRLSGRISFLGLRQDVPDLLSRSHVFVLVSRWEGFPISILEAMRAGLPVVASGVGGVSEAVAHGRTGFVVERYDAAGLAHGLRALIRSRSLRERMGNAGRQRYLDRFTLKRMAQRTIQVYLRVLEQGKGKHRAG